MGTGPKFRIVVIVGTRPDALKMYPIYRELKEAALDVVVISTTQHSDLLTQVFEELDFYPDFNLDVMVEDQELSDLTGRLVARLDEAYRKFCPDLVLVQGDTTSSMVAALVSYYHKVPVNHVEAGLRTGTHVSDYHFAPTPRARENLIGEGIDGRKIFVTGNTAIDTLMTSLEKRPKIRDKKLKEILDSGDTLIAVTAHRRESFGEPLGELAEALIEIGASFNGTRVVYPVHPNPSVREPITGILAGKEGVELLDPLCYGDLIQLLNNSWLILTDSGGIQEEAPSLGKPVVILREKTERIESIDSGIGLLVGLDRRNIVQVVSSLLLDKKQYQSMVPVENPYGDGYAAKRIVSSIMHRHLGRESQPEAFPG
jgi:UDP-N-acetylglucosamine 2-epimerase (non-hydrolysing)